jgi:hypothetical protein
VVTAKSVPRPLSKLLHEVWLGGLEIC